MISTCAWRHKLDSLPRNRLAMWPWENHLGPHYKTILESIQVAHNLVKCFGALWILSLPSWIGITVLSNLTRKCFRLNCTLKIIRYSYCANKDYVIMCNKSFHHWSGPLYRMLLLYYSVDTLGTTYGRGKIAIHIFLILRVKIK